MTYDVLSGSDEDLMRSYCEGDSRAFEALYKRLSPKVLGYLRSRLRNKEDVDDVFQKVFSKFHATRESYNDAFPVLQWMFVISRSALLDHLKSSNRKENLKAKISFESLSQIPPDPSLSHQMDRDLLKDLSADAKEVVQLRVIDELSFEEIAARIGKSESGVRQLLSRSLRKMKLSLGGS